MSVNPVVVLDCTGNATGALHGPLRGERLKAYFAGFQTACETSGARVVVFETSGVIDAGDIIYVSSGGGSGEDDYLYIAGATAPSPGITLKNVEIQIAAHDVFINHIRGLL